MEIKNLDNVVREEKAAQLLNCIIPFMITHGMTVENLEDTCEQVREIYRKNATMKAGEAPAL